MLAWTGEDSYSVDAALVVVEGQSPPPRRPHKRSHEPHGSWRFSLRIVVSVDYLPGTPQSLSPEARWKLLIKNSCSNSLNCH